MITLEDYEFWLWKSHGLIRRKNHDGSWTYPEVWNDGRWEMGSAYAVDAITGMGEDPYSCGEWAQQLSVKQAQEYAAKYRIDLLGPNQSSGRP